MTTAAALDQEEEVDCRGRGSMTCVYTRRGHMCMAHTHTHRHTHTHTHTQYTQQTGTSQDTGSSQEGLFAQILVRHSQHKSMAIVWLR